MFVDTHCHLFKEYYDNIDEVIKESCDKNIKYYINNGCDHKSNIEVIECLKKYENVYGAIGIHPENVLDYTLDDIKFIEDNLNNEKIVAIGEIGLDYHYTKELKDEQKKLLEMQLDMATKYNMPVVIHSRDATEDTIEILKKYNLKGVIHSFSGSLEVAKIYIKMGYLIGVNGVITFKNAHLKEVIKSIGIDNIILETDAPYLTPEPFRGHKNSPAYVLNIAEFVADLFDVTLDDVSRITNENVKKLYNKMKLD